MTNDQRRLLLRDADPEMKEKWEQRERERKYDQQQPDEFNKLFDALEELNIAQVEKQRKRDQGQLDLFKTSTNTINEEGGGASHQQLDKGSMENIWNIGNEGNQGNIGAAGIMTTVGNTGHNGLSGSGIKAESEDANINAHPMSLRPRNLKHGAARHHQDS